MAGIFNPNNRFLRGAEAARVIAALPRAGVGLPAPAGVPGLGLRPAVAPLQEAKNKLDAAGNDKGARKEALRDAARILSGQVYPVNVVDLAKNIQESIDYPNFQIDEKYEEMKRLIAAEQEGARRRGKKSRKPRKGRASRGSRKHRRTSRRKMRGGCWGGSGCS